MKRTVFLYYYPNNGKNATIRGLFTGLTSKEHHSIDCIMGRLNMNFLDKVDHAILDTIFGAGIKDPYSQGILWSVIREVPADKATLVRNHRHVWLKLQEVNFIGSTYPKYYDIIGYDLAGFEQVEPILVAMIKKRDKLLNEDKVIMDAFTHCVRDDENCTLTLIREIDYYEVQ